MRWSTCPLHFGAYVMFCLVPSKQGLPPSRFREGDMYQTSYSLGHRKFSRDEQALTERKRTTTTETRATAALKETARWKSRYVLTYDNDDNDNDNDNYNNNGNYERNCTVGDSVCINQR